MHLSKFSLLLGIILTFNSCSKDFNSLNDNGEPLVPVNLTARDSAKKLYEDYYLPSKSVSNDIAWSGDEPSCNAGDVPQSTMD